MEEHDIEVEIELGELPQGWSWSTLGKVCEKPQYGWTTKADKENGKIKLLRTTDISPGDIDWNSVPYCTEEPDDLDKYLIESGDIVISRAGSVGVSYLLTEVEPAVFASYLIRFRPKSGIDERYLYHYLQSSTYWTAIGASKAGIAVPNVNAKKLARVPFPLAPLPEQRRIVAAIELQLGRLDAAVARLHAAKAKLKRYRQAVLKAAYDEAAEAHEMKTFGELKEFSMYGPRFSSDDYTSSGVPVLRTSDIDERGQVNMNTAPKLDLTKEQVAKYKLKLGDLLITRTGSIGTVSVFNDNVDAIAGAFLIQYRLGQVDPWYAFHFLRGPVAQHHLLGNIAGIGRPNLNVAGIDSLEMPVPPLMDQVAIRKRIETTLNRVAETDSTLDAQFQQAVRLRQAVLKRAFEGKLV